MRETGQQDRAYTFVVSLWYVVTMDSSHASPPHGVDSGQDALVSFLRATPQVKKSATTTASPGPVPHHLGFPLWLAAEIQEAIRFPRQMLRGQTPQGHPASARPLWLHFLGCGLATAKKPSSNDAATAPSTGPSDATIRTTARVLAR